MKKVPTVIIILAITVVVLTTSPARLSAPSLLMTLFILVSLVGIVLYRAFGHLDLFQKVAPTRRNNKSLMVAVLMLIFLYALSLIDNLTLRDVILAGILSLVSYVYMTKKYMPETSQPQ